jgi:hypothetical protein
MVNNSAFCPQNENGFRMILRINSYHFPVSMNQLIFAMEKCGVFFKIRTECLNTTKTSCSNFHHSTFSTSESLTFSSTYLYQKDERAQPRNLHRQKSLPAPVKYSVSHYSPSTFSFSLSLFGFEGLKLYPAFDASQGTLGTGQVGLNPYELSLLSHHL